MPQLFTVCGAHEQWRLWRWGHYFSANTTPWVQDIGALLFAYVACNKFRPAEAKSATPQITCKSFVDRFQGWLCMYGRPFMSNWCGGPYPTAIATSLTVSTQRSSAVFVVNRNAPTYEPNVGIAAHKHIYAAHNDCMSVYLSPHVYLGLFADGCSDQYTH